MLQFTPTTCICEKSNTMSTVPEMEWPQPKGLPTTLGTANYSAIIAVTIVGV